MISRPNPPRLKSTTPRNLTGSVKRFLETAGLSKKAVYLPFTFVADEYFVAYCLDNCEEESKRTSCQIVYGWVIWEDRRNKFIEAEFHSIIAKAGVLYDITPRRDDEKRILFVRDASRAPHRVDEITWSTYSNIKASSGEIYEHSSSIQICNGGQTMQEKIRNADSA